MKVVFTAMPFAIAAFFVALGGGLCARLAYDTGAEWIRIAGLIAFAVGFVCFAWGLKEFRSPSRWRPRPEWLREYEARARR
ncbi:hypothetical protein ASE19_11585 [Nocardioides sp. Root79]|nr:hypothetical protein ASE19_11585 [Nocardioides sp. Root79]KRC72556.1 hypothetical protein ASE20_08115 [Nocardioides sp. Root240]